MKPTIEWKDNTVVMIDQRKLPNQEIYVCCRDHDQVADAIEKMVIRGAPAIGIAAAYGVALGVLNLKNNQNLDTEFQKIYSRLEKTRPTARNLFWALEEMKNIFLINRDLELKQLQELLITEAKKIDQEDLNMCKKIGFWGNELIESGQTILTHCNAGGLATAGYGTALGVIRAAFESGKKIVVYADETRPFLQGARLTCWELHQANIPAVLITDNMAGHLMQRGHISLVLTGADRITSDGDAANKIGTYSLAVLAKEHGLPFYIAAPMNTIDFSLSDGKQIPIEERHPDEVRKINDVYITIPEMKVRNPAFDVTPAELINAIITEKGIAFPPYTVSLELLR